MNFFNRVRVSTSTVGTSTLALGSALPGYASFQEAGVADGDRLTYCLEDGNNFEVGRGVYSSSGQTLTRAQILLSKVLDDAAGTTPLSLSGAARVFLTASGEDVRDAGAHFSVKSYGATGDGSTQDHVAIQAAIDAAEASAIIKRVYLPDPAVAYVFGATVTIPEGVTVFGDNLWDAGLSRCKPAAAFTAPLFQSESYGSSRVLRIGLIGLTLDGSSTTLTAARFNCQQSVFRDLSIRDCFTYGLHIGGIGSGLSEQALNNSIDRCYFAGQIGVTEFFDALFLDYNTADTKVTHCYFEAAKDALIRSRAYNDQISGCHLFGSSGSGGGAGVGYYSETSADKIFTGNYIENTNREAVWFNAGGADVATLNATVVGNSFRNIDKGNTAAGVIVVQGSDISSFVASGNVLRRDAATAYSTAYFVYFSGITPTQVKVFGNEWQGGLVTVGETNLVLQTLARPTRIFNVLDYGAVGNGIADDTAEIQATIDACGVAGGGNVIIPPGSWLTSGVLTVAYANVHIIGAGQEATKILTAVTNINVIRFYNAVKYLGGSVRDLHIQCTGTATAGAGIALENVGAVNIFNVSIKQTYRGVTFSGDDTACRLENVDAQQTVSNGFWINSDGNNQYLKNCTTFGCNGAILVTKTLGWWMEGCVTQADLGNGFVISAATGAVVQNGFIVNCDIDDSNANGIHIDSSGGGNIINIRMVNTRSGFADFKALAIDGAQTDYLSFVNCNFERSIQEGISITNGTQICFSNCSVLGNSSAGAGSNGIKISGGDKIQITGGISGAYPDVGNNQGYGLEITSGFTGQLLVSGVDLTGNATGGVSNASTSKDVRIYNCPGHVMDWIVVPKTTNQTRTATTTLANDSALSFPMAANTNYQIRVRIWFDTVAAADFKYGIAAPASPSLVRSVRRHIDPSATTTLVVSSEISYPAFPINAGAGTDGGYLELDLIVHNGVNAGTWAFQWAQNSSDAGNTIVRAGSYLEYRVV